MMKVVSAAALLLAACPPAVSMFAQAPPAVTYDAPSTGFSLPLAGQLTYAISGGETAYVNYAGSKGNAYTTQVGATVGLITSSNSHPFSLLYGGGISIFTGGIGNSTYYQSLDFSQQLIREKWTYLVSNSLRITPDLALGGVSGTAGAGDLGTGTAGGPDAGLLTPNQNRITESVQGSAARSLSGATSLNLGGGFNMLRSPSGAVGVDSNSTSVNAGLEHHFDARNEMSGSYFFMHSTQSSTGFKVNSHSAMANVTHVFSPTWSASVGAGPQYFTATSVGISSSSLSYSASASVDHQIQFTTLSASFSRSLRNTASYGASAETTNAGFNVSHSFSPLMRASANMSYMRTGSLPGVGTNVYSSGGYYVGAQLNRTISRLWSAYFSYTLEDQNVTGNTGGLTPLQGFQHLIGFGISFAPLPVTLHGH